MRTAPGLPSGETSHYGRTQAMTWCKANGVDYIFGLSGNRALHRLAYDVANAVRVRCAEASADKMRGFAASPTPPVAGLQPVRQPCSACENPE